MIHREDAATAAPPNRGGVSEDSTSKEGDGVNVPELVDTDDEESEHEEELPPPEPPPAASGGAPSGGTPSTSSDSTGPTRTPIRIATYNIQSGRSGRLEFALRAVGEMKVDICFFTEAKLTDGIHTRMSNGYQVVATKALSHRQGGVALCFRQSEYWQVEAFQRHGPNVVSAVLVTGSRRQPLVGAYIPPEDTSTIEYVDQALKRFETGPNPILLGDLNVSLSDPPSGDRSIQIVTMLANHGLIDMLPHFGQRRSHAGLKTWRQIRNGRLVTARCDYLLASDRRIFANVCIRDPRHFTSDHLMVMGILQSATHRANQTYLRGRKRFPLRPTKMGPATKVDSLFQQLKSSIPKAVYDRNTPRRAWISDKTWKLVDQRSALGRSPTYTQKEHRRLSRAVKASLREDRKQRCASVGQEVESYLSDPKTVQEAWNRIRTWYRHAEDRAPKPARADLQKVTEEYASLYRKSEPAGDPIPVVVAPFDVPDDIPTESEIESAVMRLRSGKAPGPSRMRTDHLKEWLANANREEDRDTTKWDALVDLVQTCYQTGDLPSELAWASMVLLPKDSGGFRGIGLLEVIWKVLSSIMNARMAATINLHDALHGFRPGRGTSTAIIEAKLVQQLARRRQCPFYEIFIDLRKAYDTLDRERALAILEGYGVGPRAIRLLRQFWDQQQVVARQSDYHGDPFGATRGVTQGDIISPMIFNIIADAVIRYWLSIVSSEPDDAITGLGANLLDRTALFYADDGMLGSTDPEWLQGAFDTLSGLFERVGLRTNEDKTKAMVCTPGSIRSQVSQQAYKRRWDGHGPSYRQRKRHRTSCPECGKELREGSLVSHLRTQHGMDLPGNAGVAPPPAPNPVEYRVNFPPTLDTVECPAEGCPYLARSRTLLRRHFVARHPTDSLFIVQDGRSWPCESCHMVLTTYSRDRHAGSELCRATTQRRRQARLLLESQQASERRFTAVGVELESVSTFKYLGRPLSKTDSDWPALHRNLAKARAKWAMISKVLVREGATPVISGKFYKAVVQAVLLYGSDTWVWTEPMLNALRGFHHRVARRLSGRVPRLQNGTWVYPPIDGALRAAGLWPIEEYIARRRRTTLRQVEGRPIYQLCREQRVLPGSPTRTAVWWEQNDKFPVRHDEEP